MAIDGVGLFQGIAHGLSHQQGCTSSRLHVGSDVVEQQHKFITTQPCHGVVGGYQFCQALCNLYQQDIAQGVSAGIVDLLEIVQIDEQQRTHLP